MLTTIQLRREGALEEGVEQAKGRIQEKEMAGTIRVAMTEGATREEPGARGAGWRPTTQPGRRPTMEMKT